MGQVVPNLRVARDILLRWLNARRSFARKLYATNLHLNLLPNVGKHLWLAAEVGTDFALEVRENTARGEFPFGN